MNHCYKTIFNRRLDVWQAVAEIARGCGKGGGMALSVAGVVLAGLPVVAAGADRYWSGENSSYFNNEKNWDGGTVVPQVTDNLFFGNNTEVRFIDYSSHGGRVIIGHNENNMPGNGVMYIESSSLSLNYEGKIFIGTGGNKGSLILGNQIISVTEKNNLFLDEKNDSEAELVIGVYGSAMMPMITVGENGVIRVNGDSHRQGTLATWIIQPSGGKEGKVVLNGGVLKLQSASPLFGQPSPVQIEIPIILEQRGGIFATSEEEDKSISSNISGSGALTKRGSGVLVLTGKGTYSGGTVVSEGTLRSGNENAFVQGTGYAVNGGTLDLANFDLSMSSLSGSGGKVVLGTADLVISQSTDTVYAGAISGAGKLTKKDTGVLTLSGGNDYTGGTAVESGVLQVGNGSTTGSISGDVGISSGAALAFNRSNEIDYSGVISGGGKLVKKGGGVLMLSGGNDYTGGTIVESGTLQVGNGSATGSISGDVNINSDAVLVFNRSNEIDYSGVVSGAGRLEKHGTGMLRMSGANSYRGGTVVNEGTLSGLPGSFPHDTAYVVNEGVLDISNQTGMVMSALSGLGGKVNFGAEGLEISQVDDTTYAGVISGAGKLVKKGDGVLTLSGGNDYTGGTVVERGALQVGSGSTTGSISGDMSINSDAVLAFNRSNEMAYSGVISGGGRLVKKGDGVLTLSGGNDYTGGTAVESGVLQVGNGSTTGSISGDVSINSDAVLAFNRSNEVDYSGVISGAGRLEKHGTGMLQMSGANSYHGGTVVNGGTLSGLPGSFPYSTAYVVNEGILDISNQTGMVMSALSGLGGKVNFGAEGLEVSQTDDTTYAGVISGDGKLVKKGGGVLMLSGGNDYTGGTIVESGTLQVGNGSATGSISGDVSINSDAVLVFNRSNEIDYSGVVSGAGRLEKHGTGMLRMSGANSYRGGTVVAGGSLVSLSDSLPHDTDYEVNGGILDLNNHDLRISTLSGAAAGAVTLGTANLQVEQGSFAGVITGDGGLIKAGGNGTLILSGTNAYTGGTTVQAGTLQAGSATALPADSRYLIDGKLDLNNHPLTALHLAGSGTVRGAAVTIPSGGTLKGQQGQTLTTDDLTLAAGAMVGATLDAPAAPVTSGLFQVNGNLTLNGAKLDVTDAGHYGAGVYRLFDYTGTLTESEAGKGLLLGSVPTGLNSTLQSLTTSKQINLVVSTPVPDLGPGPAPTPEPSPGPPPPIPTVQFWNGAATGNVWRNGPESAWSDASGTQGHPWGGHFAVFQSAPAGITIANDAGAVSVTGLQFIGNGWSVSGDALTLDGDDGASVVRVGDGTTAGANWSATFHAPLAGAGALVKDDLGTLVLAGVNTYAGGTVIQAGTLQLGNGGASGAILGDVVNHGVLAFHRADAFRFDGAISGAGDIRHTGSGRTTLTGDASRFTGTTQVLAGTLAVNGSLGGTLAVQAGGRLQGTGTVGSTIVHGTAAPGNSIGTLKVAGSLAFGPGSVYEVETNAAGQSDRIEASGIATLAGGTVRVLAEAGDYAPATDYTILSAAGGVMGAFEGVTSNLAFLAPSLRQDANAVHLRLTRNDTGYRQVGQTPNQVATGSAVEGLGAGNPVHDAVQGLSAQQARSAFDRLSGEIHASARTALIADSRFVRDAANDRLRAAFALPGASRVQTAAYGVTPAHDARQARPAGRDAGWMAQASAAASTASAAPGAAPLSTPVSADHAGPVFWSQGYGDWGTADGDGNAAGLDRSGGGLLAGVDAPVGHWRLGGLAGYGHSRVKAQGRRSSGSSDNYHLGVYGGTSLSGWSVRAGAAYTWHHADTQRSVAVGGMTDRAKGRYRGGTWQAYGELGRTLPMGAAQVEPFIGLAHVRLHTDGHAEQGGAAALATSAAETAATFATLGVRGAHALTLGPWQATLSGTVGWRHAFGDVTPAARQRFAEGAAFTVTGVPVARNSAVVEAGLDLRLSSATVLGVSYGGQLASGARDHAVKASLAIRF